MFGMIRNLILDFILYFVAAYIKDYPTHVISAQGTAQNTSLEEVSKNILWQTIYNSNYTQKFFFQNYYNEKWQNIR